MFLNYRRERNFHIHQSSTQTIIITFIQHAVPAELSIFSDVVCNLISCEDLTPSKQEEFSPEGSTVTLSYRYSKTIAVNDYFYWYRQYPGKPPEFLILHWGTKPASNSRLSVKSDEDKTQIYLSISSVAVTDSAVYYCAVEPKVKGNTTTLYTNLLSKDNTILHSIHQRESLSVRL
ncbi:hypothetical protein JOQ06_022982 [Pogonophryne albipinna]|uniref:Ig-like domain-containing protein n=1 Tax=Pogonophryne albipinna TaxID=1090488 RepID=A0AAD6F5P4_9TELE|nr:hypothetical protein JOQ06_022982 [Pogonophryne albipinna]